MARKSPKVTLSMPFHQVVLRFAGIVAIAALTGVVASGLAIPWAGVAGKGAQSGAAAVRKFPQDLDVGQLSQTTRVLDSKGHLITTLYDQNRVYRPLKDISPNMVHALLSTEDARFYQHGALDLKGTLRALIKDQTNGGAVQGGSSITQQLVKQTLLYNAKSDAQRKEATEDTVARKVRELRYAIALEEKHSKSWILERYLNTAYFGDSAYGVQAAAKHYFGVDAKDLSWGQAAMLAGMVKNPSGYNPTSHPDAATARRNVVIGRIRDEHFITPEEADKITSSGLGLHVTSNRNGCYGSKAEFFCDYALKWLLKDPSLGATEADRWRLLQTGGLTIRTTLDQRFQDAAQHAVESNVRATDEAVGAIAMVEPGSGKVKGLAQSRPMGTDRHKGQSYLNYLVPTQYGDANGFQAGSTFKVFVAATAISHGFPMHQKINSPPKKTLDQASFSNCPSAGHYAPGPWEVHNSTTSGMKDLYTGTRESVNTFYAQLERITGVCGPYDLARKMGVQLTNPDDERVPSFTLGIADVSPLEMAEAYATLAARGKHCDARPVTEIIGANGKPLKTYDSHCDQVMATGTADAVNDVLRGVMSPSGFGKHLLLRVPAAAKTGTTSSNKAVWFDGYTPSLATVSVIAGATYNGRQISLNGHLLHGRYVNDAAGSTVAGPMWADAMRRIDGLLPYRSFVKPSKATVNGKGAKVPQVKGMSVGAAEGKLRAAGFKAAVGSKVHSHNKAGTVVGVSATRAAKGSTVYLTVSRGRH